MFLRTGSVMPMFSHAKRSCGAQVDHYSIIASCETTVAELECQACAWDARWEYYPRVRLDETAQVYMIIVKQRTGTLCKNKCSCALAALRLCSHMLNEAVVRKWTTIPSLHHVEPQPQSLSLLRQPPELASASTSLSLLHQPCSTASCDVNKIVAKSTAPAFENKAGFGS